VQPVLQRKAITMLDNRGTWNEERIAQLKRCFEAGLTSSQIAREIGVTRNAVIGKVSRLGLSRGPKAVIGKTLESKRIRFARPRRARLNIFAQNEALAAAFSASSPPAADASADGGRGCTLLELGHGKCRWPINRPDSEALFCGDEPAPGLPYCMAHARIAYRPPGRLRSGTRG
jgi:GcrA cell cycle regulator